MNEDQYWVIVGTVIGTFACIGMAIMYKLIRRSSQISNESEDDFE